MLARHPRWLLVEGVAEKNHSEGSDAEPMGRSGVDGGRRRACGPSRTGVSPATRPVVSQRCPQPDFFGHTLLAPAAIAVALLSTCTEEQHCPAIYIIPFVYHAIDAESGNTVCLDSYTITSPDGTKDEFRQRGAADGECEYLSNANQEGTHKVEVEAKGYLVPEPQEVYVSHTTCDQYIGDRNLIFELVRGPDWQPPDGEPADAGTSDAGSLDGGPQQDGSADASALAPDVHED